VIATLRAVRETFQRSWRDLPATLQQDLTMLAILSGILLLLGWAYNRGFRRTERGPLLRMPLFFITGGVALLVHHIPVVEWRIGIISVAFVIAGFLGRRTHPRGLWMINVLLAAGLGLGWVVTTLSCAMAVFIVLFLSPTERR
jgi:hypothetical protein